MRLLSISIICFCCYGTIDILNNKANAFSNPDTSAVIKKIKFDFKKINGNLNNYKKKKHDVYGISAEGGEAISYCDRAGLVKISCTLYNEMGKSMTDYYFSKDQLFFVYKKNFLYDKPMYLKNFKIKKTEENRYYINRGSIIKWIIEKNSNKKTSTYESEYSLINSELKALMKVF